MEKVPEKDGIRVACKKLTQFCSCSEGGGFKRQKTVFKANNSKYEWKFMLLLPDSRPDSREDCWTNENIENLLFVGQIH